MNDSDHIDQRHLCEKSLTYGEGPMVSSNGVVRSAPDTRLPGVAVVGLGYWGPNWVRNFQQLQCAHRVIACDLDARRRNHVKQLHPSVEKHLVVFFFFSVIKSKGVFAPPPL